MLFVIGLLLICLHIYHQIHISVLTYLDNRDNDVQYHDNDIINLYQQLKQLIVTKYIDDIEIIITFSELLKSLFDNIVKKSTVGK